MGITKTLKQNSKFGKWLIIHDLGMMNHRHYFECKCECGTIKKIERGNLVSGKSTSCRKCSKRTNTKKRGLSRHKDYNVWCGILYRCNNPQGASYKNYGGRGIKVCERWEKSFENFIQDMGERPSREYSIERVNNNGNYEPDNCKWILKSRQAVNRRNWAIDEFSSLNISPQRKTQLRYRKKGLCVICGKQAYKGVYCEKHFLMNKNRKKGKHVQAVSPQ